MLPTPFNEVPKVVANYNTRIIINYGPPGSDTLYHLIYNFSVVGNINKR